MAEILNKKGFVMGKRKTNEEFIQELNTINPSILVIGKYVDAKTKIRVICKECNNNWEALPTNLLRRKGCPICSRKKAGNQRIISHEEFKSRVYSKNPLIEIIGNYMKYNCSVQVRCKVCNYEWSPKAGSLLAGFGCPKCAGNMRSSTIEFKQKISKISPEIEIIGEYINSNTKVTAKCKKCGYVWNVIPSSLKAGSGCPKCAGNIKSTTAEFKQKIAKISPEIEVVGEYINSHTKIKCRCKICGNEWEMTPNNLQQGQKCPKCMRVSQGIRQRKSQEDFEKKIAEISPNIQVLGKYKTAHDRVKCKCKVCGYEWNPLAWDIFRGTGCPRCSHTSTSFMEQMILMSFILALGKGEVISRDQKEIGMEIDIFLPKFRVAIEPGSWYWHKTSLKRDEEKRLLCKEKNIRLITIYDAYDKDTPPFYENCFVYNKDLGEEINHSSLKKLIYELFRVCNINKKFTENEWKSIEKKAYMNSLLRSHEDFLEEMNRVNPKVKILSNYQGYKAKVKCECNVCKFQWSSTPGHLLRGQGCPKCAGTMKKTHDEFIKQLSIKQPDVSVIGDYVNNGTKIDVKCNICGKIWKATPGNLLYGFGCPNCAIVNRRDNTLENRKNKFIANLKLKGNPNVEVLGNYIDAKTKILCKCKDCGFQWMVSPNSLLGGHGCPKCGIKKLTGRPKKSQ